MEPTIQIFRDGNHIDDIEIHVIEILNESFTWHDIRDTVIKEGNDSWSYQDLIDKAVQLQYIKVIECKEEMEYI